jgi:ATP-dependent RNA helicase DeaD
MKFNELPLQPEILQGINKSKYETMTEIQENIIPLSIEGKDVLAKAPTGTGKTAAFVIPALQNLDVNEKRVQILVLAPTRELANQITEEFKNLSMFMRGVNALAIYGGQKIDIQLKLLRNNPQILVSTPGRLLDHIKRGSINLENIKTVILDEADEMLNMGFVVDINKILSTIKQEHQTILLSATISQQIYGVSAKYQKNPVSFETKNAVVSKPNIKQHYIKINERNKAEYIIKLIKTNSWFLTVVFTNTK